MRLNAQPMYMRGIPARPQTLCHLEMSERFVELAMGVGDASEREMGLREIGRELFRPFRRFGLEGERSRAGRTPSRDRR